MEQPVVGEQTPLIPNSNNESYQKAPWGVQWRSSPWYITSLVMLAVMTDAITYTIIVPVLPYRLADLGYDNVSAHISWLLSAYTSGSVVSIFPVAYFFHRYPWRRTPLFVAVIVSLCSLVLFMLVDAFPAMFIARFMQGMAGAVVFTVGFVLIVENVPKRNVGRQVGFALSGTPFGMTIAPPLGGFFYSRFGWHAPFIFCLILCAIDTVGRFLVIEQKDLSKYGIFIVDDDASSDGGEAPDSVVKTEVEELSMLGVLKALATSRRGVNSFLITFMFGLIDGALDPTLPMHVKTVWHKDSDAVGLVFLAAAGPAFITGPLFGALADNFGAEFIMAPFLAIVLPCLYLMRSQGSLTEFTFHFALMNFFINAAVAPNGLEVAMAGQEKEGISEIHQFASLNFAFSLAGSVGAVAAGQLYDHLENGWEAVIWLCFISCLLGIPISIFMAGEIPLARRLLGKRLSKDA